MATTRFLSATGLLILLALLLTLVYLASVFSGQPYPPGSEQFWPYVVNLFLASWADADARRRRRVPCFDFGFFLVLALPVVLLWYVFWSRGRRGFLLLGVLLGVQCLPWLTATAVWVVLAALGAAH
jgi:hypothetical protein